MNLVVGLGFTFSRAMPSVAIYLVAIPLAFVHAGLACGLYVLVAVMWLVPDRRIEKTLSVSSE